MAYTQSDLDLIEAAIKEGALTVKYADKQVTYRSLDEMLRIRDLIRAELGITTPRARKFGQFNAGYFPERAHELD
jgi:hypothetical protein